MTVAKMAKEAVITKVIHPPSWNLRITTEHKINVVNKRIPIGAETEDGKLLWIHKDKVLDSNYELVDDLNYYFKDIVAGDSVLFINAIMNAKEKVHDIRITKLKK